MNIISLDHLVLTVKSIEAACKFYSEILGMKVITFGNNRKALVFGTQKINLHEIRIEFEPKAGNPTPGSADLCFITDHSMNNIIEHFINCSIPIIEGPIIRTGAIGKIESVYIRDPDLNLIEISEYK